MVNSGSVLGPYYLSGASLSLAASLFVVVSFLKFKELRVHPSPIIFWRAVFDLAFSIQFIIVYGWDNAQNHCDVFSFIFQFAVLGAQSWYFMISLDLFIALRNPFTKPGAHMKWYHLFVWSVSLLTSLVLAGTRNTQFRDGMQICWIKATDDLGDVNYLNWILFYVPTLVFYALALMVMVFAWYRLQKGLDETFKIRTTILRNGQRYVVAFSLYWTTACIIYANIYVNEKGTTTRVDPSSDISLYGTFALLIAVRSLIDVCVWTVNQQVIATYARWWKGEPYKEDAFTDINRALRKEVLLYSTQGISEGIVMAAQKAHVQQPNRAMYPEGLADDTDGRITRIELNRDDTSQKKPVPFWDFAPQVFRFLRHSFGIDDQSYTQSIAGDTNEMIERFTEGASGSFFYFSQDSKYIVKTLTKSEASFLLTFLPEYVDYVTKHTQTLISKFLGLHAVELYGLRMYFVVMESVFLTDKRIHTRYDLKGSWIDRHASRNSPSKVLKDRDLNHRLFMTQRERSMFLEQVAMDARFLRDQNIMDYSLLLGIHNARQIVIREDGDDEKLNGTTKLSHTSKGSMSQGGSAVEMAAQSGPFFQSYCGGVRAKIIEGPGIYFVGIIDVLQSWDASKKLERFAKVYFARKDPDGISAVPPYEYCERFIKAMTEITAPEEQESVIYPRTSVSSGHLQSNHRASKSSRRSVGAGAGGAVGSVVDGSVGLDSRVKRIDTFGDPIVNRSDTATSLAGISVIPVSAQLFVDTDTDAIDQEHEVSVGPGPGASNARLDPVNDDGDDDGKGGGGDGGAGGGGGMISQQGSRVHLTSSDETGSDSPPSGGAIAMKRQDGSSRYS